MLVDNIKKPIGMRVKGPIEDWLALDDINKGNWVEIVRNQIDLKDEKVQEEYNKQTYSLKFLAPTIAIAVVGDTYISSSRKESWRQVLKLELKNGKINQSNIYNWRGSSQGNYMSSFTSYFLKKNNNEMIFQDQSPYRDSTSTIILNINGNYVSYPQSKATKSRLTFNVYHNDYLYCFSDYYYDDNVVPNRYGKIGKINYQTNKIDILKDSWKTFTPKMIFDFSNGAIALVNKSNEMMLVNFSNPTNPTFKKIATIIDGEVLNITQDRFLICGEKETIEYTFNTKTNTISSINKPILKLDGPSVITKGNILNTFSSDYSKNYSYLLNDDLKKELVISSQSRIEDGKILIASNYDNLIFALNDYKFEIPYPYSLEYKRKIFAINIGATKTQKRFIAVSNANANQQVSVVRANLP